MTVVIDPTFDPVPSLSREVKVAISAGACTESARAVFVTRGGELPTELSASLSWEALKAARFAGKKGQSILLPGSPLTVLVGVGKGLRSLAELRDAVAVFANAARESARLAIDMDDIIAGSLGISDGVHAVIEGAILARYRYEVLKSEANAVPLEELKLIVSDTAEETIAQVEEGIRIGLVLARSACLSRDLGNTPPRHLNAGTFAQLVAELGPQFGLAVEVFDREQLIELGCGGLLGVNAGSVEEPRMIKIRYTPENANKKTPHLALVGKGIMYDSGGISLKPSNAMHAAMKLDMMGAAAVFAAMTALRDLGAGVRVTGWLMCTDNMPSGSATKLGDVLTIRGGTTVEVKNTDAEGRLVLADGLVLATEEERRPDAIVDIATLTGAAMMALGTRTAAMLANNDAVAAQLQRAADVSDENIWRMPLDHRYRDQLKSEVADLSNIGGQYAGAILAALFLNEFVADTPWGHLDIAGTMQSEKEDLWRPVGSTGFGARLLAEFALAFEAPKKHKKKRR